MAQLRPAQWPWHGGIGKGIVRARGLHNCVRGACIFPASFLIDPGVQEPSGSSQARHFPIPPQGPPRFPCSEGGAGLCLNSALGSCSARAGHLAEQEPGALPWVAGDTGTESGGLGSQLSWSFSSPTPTTPHRGVCPIRYGRGHLNTPSRRQGCPETCLGGGDWLPGVCPFPQIAN